MVASQGCARVKRHQGRGRSSETTVEGETPTEPLQGRKAEAGEWVSLSKQILWNSKK